MPATSSVATGAGGTWLMFALLTVGQWGLYGIFLHAGVMGFHPRTDPAARYKAFLFVGLAYFVTAVLLPAVVLVFKGTSWAFVTNGKAVTWSLLAGIVGAGGAFCVLLAFAARGRPAVVMSIIFAGAPIINALVAMLIHPPENGWAAVPWPFYIGIGLAAAGGALVTLYQPG